VGYVPKVPSREEQAGGDGGQNVLGECGFSGSTRFVAVPHDRAVVGFLGEFLEQVRLPLVELVGLYDVRRYVWGYGEAGGPYTTLGSAFLGVGAVLDA